MKDIRPQRMVGDPKTADVNKFGAVRYQRTYSSLKDGYQTHHIPGKMSKFHIYQGRYAEKTLCRWNFSTDHLKQFTFPVDIDNLHEMDGENVCMTCYKEYLKRTGRAVRYTLELEGDCGCKLIVDEFRSEKIYRVQYCRMHSAYAEV